MKIKIITCHDVYNLGASLQAYALSKYLIDLGNEVEIINYKPDYLSVHFRLFGGVNPSYDKPFLREIYQILKFPIRLKARLGKRKKEFDKFTSILPLTKVKYSSNEDLKKNYPYVFDPNIEISSIFGCFPNCIWMGGGHFHSNVFYLSDSIERCVEFYNKNNMPIRFTFTNPVLTKEMYHDQYGHRILEIANTGMNEIITSIPDFEKFL